MKLIYNVEDRPKIGQVIVYAIQQLLAIMAATLVVPVIIGNGMQPSAALLGAGVGTLVYLLFTKFKSPVFLGSSFAFLGSMAAAFAGAASVSIGYAGLIIGAVIAGLVYVIIAIIVKIAGVKWIDALMPKQVIGPTVAIIGLSLAGNAVGDLQKGGYTTTVTSQALENGEIVEVVSSASTANVLIAVLVGLVTLAVTMLCSAYGKKTLKLIPFIIGILSGYAVAAVFTAIGIATGNDALRIIDFGVFADMKIIEIPEFTFMTAIKGVKELGNLEALKETDSSVIATYITTVAVAYAPVAFVVFAEHIADHKNISSIIERDLLEEPGLHRTLLGDGIGSMVGAFFGGCPNTTYGESVACVAITGNASVVTIFGAALGAILISFISPFVRFVNSIPPCVMGGVCMALYGFIAVSGLKMIKDVDLGKNKNLFVVSVILIAGIGGLTLTFGKITITSIAVALILGILANLMLRKAPDEE